MKKSNKAENQRTSSGIRADAAGAATTATIITTSNQTKKNLVIAGMLGRRKPSIHSAKHEKDNWNEMNNKYEKRQQKNNTTKLQIRPKALYLLLLSVFSEVFSFSLSLCLLSFQCSSSGKAIVWMTLVVIVILVDFWEFIFLLCFMPLTHLLLVVFLWGCQIVLFPHPTESRNIICHLSLRVGFMEQYGNLSNKTTIKHSITYYHTKHVNN